VKGEVSWNYVWRKLFLHITEGPSTCDVSLKSGNTAVTLHWTQSTCAHQRFWSKTMNTWTTPLSWILKNLIVSRVVEKCPPPLPVYGIWRIITVFTITQNRSLSISTSQIVYVMYILILFAHLLSGLLSGLFPSGFSTGIEFVCLFLPCVLHCPALPSSLIWSPS
jgi:hypothetical protein